MHIIKRKNFKQTAIASAMVMVCLLSACGKDEKQQQAGGNFAMPVEYSSVKIADIPVYSNLIGRATAVRTAEVRPQVSGVILKRYFQEGSVVKQGEQLYQIDPAMYEAQLASAKAALSQAEASLYSAKLKYDRYSKLINTNAISKQDYDDAQSGYRIAQASVLAAQAAVQTAEINLKYTKVYAPITGTIGRSNVTEGALVTTNQAVSMSTITQLDPIYIDLGLSVSELLNMRMNIDKGLFDPNLGNNEQVELFLENGQKLDQKGILEFSEVTVDESTGMVNVRVRVPNSNNYLLPGMYIRANVNQGTQKDSLLVPQIAIIRLNNGTSMVYTIGPENTVVQKIVTISGEIDHDYIISDGLNKDDKIITSHLQILRPNAKVTPIDSNNSQPAENNKD